MSEGEGAVSTERTREAGRSWRGVRVEVSVEVRSQLAIGLALGLLGLGLLGATLKSKEPLIVEGLRVGSKGAPVASERRVRTKSAWLVLTRFLGMQRGGQWG